MIERRSSTSFRAFTAFSLRGCAAALLVTLSGIAAGATPVVEWRIEVVDPAGTGKFSSLKIDTSGNAHVCYVDIVQLTLKYGFWDHSLKRWFTTALDKSSGFCSLALDSKQHPHISYIAYPTGVKYMFWNPAGSGSWEKRDIRINAKDISYYTSISLDAQDNPSITYYEYWGVGEDYTLRLRNVAWDGSVWKLRTVDPTPGSGKFNSLGMDSEGSLHVAYANVKAENAGLRYAHWNGRSWDIAVLEGRDQSYYVYSVMLALDKENTPHIAYTDVANHVLKYAARRGGKWQIEPVDLLKQEAYPDRNGIALDEKGTPYISYYDGGRGILKLAHLENKKWVTEIVDENFAGFTSSLQINNGTIWITYADEYGQALKCARRPLAAVDLNSQEKSPDTPKYAGAKAQ